MNLLRLCLNKICSNLYLYYRFCKMESVKLPSFIGQLIFDNSFKILGQFSENELKFFKYEITELKKINLQKKQFDSIKYYDFLNGHHLDELQIGFIENFYIKSKNFVIFTKDLKINYNLDVVNENFKFLTYIYAEKSISVFYLSGNENFNSFTTVLKNSSKLLQELYIGWISLSIEHYRRINDILKEKKNLKKFLLRIDNWNNEDKTSEFAVLDQITRKTTELNIDFEHKIPIGFPRLIENMSNLNSIGIDTALEDDDITKSFLRCLNGNIGFNLKILILTFKNITLNIDGLLVENLKYCKKLTSFSMSVIENSHLTSNIFKSLIPCTNSLEIIYLPFTSFSNFNNIVDNFLINCSSLKKFDFHLFFLFHVKIESINICLEKSKETLESIIFADADEMKQVSHIKYAKFKKLERIIIKRRKINNDSMKFLFKSIENIVTNLTSFSIIGLEANDYYNDDLISLLSNCNNLSKLSFNYYKLTAKDLYSVLTAISAPELIVSLEFFSCEIEDDLLLSIIPLIKKFKNLEHMNLSHNLISEISIQSLLENLGKYNFNMQLLRLLPYDPSIHLLEYLSIYSKYASSFEIQ